MSAPLPLRIGLPIVAFCVITAVAGWRTALAFAFACIVAAVVAMTVMVIRAHPLRQARDSGKSRKDAARWKSAASLADLGELVIAWLNGEITRTPGHYGPPCDETIPLIPALTVINRGGFVTDNSQLAESVDGRTWNTWVDGFATDETLARIRAAITGTSLIVRTCRGRVHEHERNRFVFVPCPRTDVTDFWASACPAVSDALRESWWVQVEDPEPGRNDLLWPTLTAALEGDS